ncbi:hypothetical protein AB6A40_011057 [Gnathostoma spinigerum]|uniref:Uncharacterized protein n=1 Tax=Gnathostoma spinigerum TaxID=75299 RepID=A0ABD6EX49_9BILA
MPWNVPAPFPHRKSVLSRADHQRYVAIVTNFLKPEVQLRYKHNRLEINSMDQQLAEERQEFQRLTLKNVLNKRKLAFSNCSKKAAEFVLTRLRKRCDFDGCFMKSPDLEFKEWTGGVGSEYANIDQAPILKNTLHPGLMPKISIPNERRKYVFDLNAENVESRFPPSESNKYPIELDELAVHFAMKNSISVMMDLSATLAILCNPWINDNCSYALPVNVRHQFNSVYS